MNSKESIMHKGSTLAFKSMTEITSLNHLSKQGYQWPDKKDSCPPYFFYRLVYQRMVEIVEQEVWYWVILTAKRKARFKFLRAPLKISMCIISRIPSLQNVSAV